MSTSSIGAFDPQDLLHFVELDEFADDWESLGLDREVDLWNLEELIMLNPEAGDVIAGTGGLRKLRFGRAGNRIGKSGGARVCYVYFREYSLDLLVAAYNKNEKDNLTASEKKYIQQYINQSRSWLRRLKR